LQKVCHDRNIFLNGEDPQTHTRTYQSCEYGQSMAPSLPPAASQQPLTAVTLRSFCKPKVRHRTHNRASLVPELIHTDQVNRHQFYFSHIHVNASTAIPNTTRPTDLQFYDECAWFEISTKAVVLIGNHYPLSPPPPPPPLPPPFFFFFFFF